MLAFTDETGRQVSIPQPVRRIVSMAPNLTETLYALGAQDRLVADTDYCDYPPDAQAKPKIGGAINPNLEQVVAFRPDLVLATRALNRRETVEALEALGLAVYATDPRSVAGVLESTARVAEVIGSGEEGLVVVARLRARLEEVRRRVGPLAPRRVLFVVWQHPLISIGPQTFLADALRWAGAESVVEVAQDWPHVSLEEALRLQPEYLVFASSHSEGALRDLEALRSRPGWRNLTAVREGHLAVVSDAINRPSPRLADAIEQLARQLHPQAFAEKAGSEARHKETRPLAQLKGDGPEEVCPCGR